MDLHVFPIPIPPPHLPLYPIPLGLPSAPGQSICLMHPTWAGDRAQNILMSVKLLCIGHTFVQTNNTQSKSWCKLWTLAGNDVSM